MLNTMIDTQMMMLSAYFLWSNVPDSIKTEFANHVSGGGEPTDDNVIVYIRKEKSAFDGIVNYYVEVTKIWTDGNPDTVGMYVNLTDTEAAEVNEALKSAVQYALEHIDDVIEDE